MFNPGTARNSGMKSTGAHLDALREEGQRAHRTRPLLDTLCGLEAGPGSSKEVDKGKKTIAITTWTLAMKWLE